MIRHEDIDNGLLMQKMHKVCCCDCVYECNCLFSVCRKAVSGHKVRYIEGDFNLDLTYVTQKIIVHGFPATGLEHMYRNPRLELRRFLETKHKDHYKVYNFCCEPGRGYPPETFENRVERYPFRDHHTPKLTRMIEFANSAKEWLDADPANITAMHCKAGKGRAGLMCCVLLFRMGIAQSAQEAFNLYDSTRVDNGKGLTVTSQRKYVIFYEHLWRKHWGVKGNVGGINSNDAKAYFTCPKEPEIKILKIKFVTTDGKELKQLRGMNLRFQLSGEIEYNPFTLADVSVGAGAGGAEHVAEVNATVSGNFKLVVTRPGNFCGLIFKKKKVLELMHNTLFLDPTTEIVFGQDQIDVSKKTTKWLGSKWQIVLTLEKAVKDAKGGNSISLAGPKTSVPSAKTVAAQDILSVNKGKVNKNARNPNPLSEIEVIDVGGKAGKAAAGQDKAIAL